MITGHLRGPIAGGAAGTLALQVFQTGCRFAISLALARMLGASGYGAYSFAIACVGVLSVLARLGFDSFLVRAVASYRSRNQWEQLHGVLLCAFQSALLASIAVALATAGVIWALVEHFQPQIATSLLIGLFLLPLLSLLSIVRAAMIGLQKVLLGLVPEMLVQPTILAGLLAAAAILPFATVSAPIAVGLSTLGALAALLSAVVILRKVWPREISLAKPEYFLGAWMRSAGAFVTISGLNVLGTSLGIIMLGSMSGASAAGIFGITNTAAALIALPLLAINTPLAPAISSAFSNGNKAEIQRLATKSARGAVLLCLPLALVYVLFGETFLGMFGEEFTAGYTTLLILTAGQVFNAALGSVGVLLQMTGHERDVVLALATAVVLNIVLNLVLIPYWGVEGAAVGTAANLVVWNTILLVRVQRRIAIRPTAIG